MTQPNAVEVRIGDSGYRTEVSARGHTLVAEGDLTEEQRAGLLQIADRCPVGQTLERGINIVPVEPQAT